MACRSPDDTKLLVKRIIALPGDVVSAHRARCAPYCDPAETTEQIQTLPPYPDREVRIPEGHVWIEGERWSSARVWDREM